MTQYTIRCAHGILVILIIGAIDMTWSEYMIKAAHHSKGNAQHWFRYLRKYIDKCDVVFSLHDVDELFRNDSLTPFQRVSVKAAFEDGSPTRLYIQSLNSKPDRSKLTVLREKYEREQPCE